ncbi:MAG: hypothetical protein QOD88_4530, partial [Mycobacterium sp.]|nr:hypothetical protein [Mycobacterium sp.]
RTENSPGSTRSERAPWRWTDARRSPLGVSGAVLRLASWQPRPTGRYRSPARVWKLLPKLNTRVRFPSSAPRFSGNTVLQRSATPRRCHNSVQTRSGGLQHIILAMRVQAHRQTGVFVCYPCGDHDGGALQVHRGGAGTPGGVQLDMPDARRLQRVSPISGQRGWRVRVAELIADEVGPGAVCSAERHRRH